MTVSEYISQMFMDFGVKLSDAAVLGIALRNSLDAGDDVLADNFSAVETAVVKAVPMLLLTPSSISEGGLSISKAQHDSILEFYKMRCKELGIKDELTRKPKIKFL